MDNEIESLWLSLGIKPDDPSASDAVDKIIKTIQSKLKSSIYGGKDGVITLPATIEGKFKNGREIDKSITDAYAAIYEKAKKMADESVSLTLNDIKDFKAQIDKFGKKTAKYKGSDIIANANNNLRQMLSDYQDFVNDLRKQVSVQQKTQIKQTQKAKAQQKAKTKKSYHGITDEEIDDAIAKENARQVKIKARRDKEAEQVASRLDVRSGSIDAGRTNKKEAMASEFSEYSSNWARELAKSLKENYSTKLTNHFYDKEFKEGPKGSQSRPTTKEEYLNALSTQAIKELSGLIGKVEKGKEDVTFEQIVDAIGVVRTLFEENGKSMATIAKSITTATQRRYDQPQDTQPDDHGDRKKIYKKDRYGNRIGGIDAEEGTDRGVGEGHAQAQEYQRAIQQLLKKMLGEVEDISEQEVQANKVAEEMVKETKKSKTKKTKNSAYERAKTEAKTSGASEDTRRLAEELKKGTNKDDKTEINRLSTNVKNVGANVKEGTKATNVQTTYDKMDNVKKDTDEAKHRQVDEVNRDINKDVARSVKADEMSGFNTDSKADRLIELVEEILRVLKPKETKESAKKAFTALNGGNDIKLLGDGLKKSLGEIYKEAIKEGKTPEEAHKIIADESNKRKGKEDKEREPITNGPEPPRGLRGTVPPPPEPKPYQNKVEKSTIFASPIKRTIRDTFQNFMNDITGASKMYKETINASNEDQDRMAAERVRIWGMNNGRNPNDTGDIAAMRRILELYRNNKASIEQNPELMQKIKLTDGIKIDTTEVTKVFNKALSGKQMRNAQMGGSPMQQILGAMRGFTFMPSVEKSRAQADGLNQILGNVNKALNSVLANIQMHETTLAGMEKAGDVEFDDNGYITKGTSAAKKTLADLEESKYVLETIMADLLANEKIVKRTGNNYSQMTKQLSFTSPVLRDNNAILRNMNAGLDKNGKALKFQTRMAEILNYTFQLIGRSIGQWFKKIISMLNPLNILKNTIKTITGWVKDAFQDFGSYDVKWQRTMNVIKINFQRIIKPAMEWIAQQLVNIIGFFDIISQRIQVAFGQIPISLFDQAGAESEKIRRNLEEAANVSLGFDELHDIGTDQSGANNLMGDIYKPQLSQDWIDMATKLGDTLGGFFKGDLGFGDVCKVILELLGKLLGTIGKMIWDWFKETSLGKWITEHWKGLLVTLLTLFVGWQLLKIAGPTLFKALFGWISKSAIAPLFNKVGGWISEGLSFISGKLAGLFTGSGFLAQLGAGFNSVFKGGGLIGLVKDGALTFGSALGTIIGGALIAVVGGLIGDGIHDAARDSMESNNMYDIGLMENGGKESDKKGRGVLNTIGVIGGDALKFGSIGAGIGGMFGGPLGMLIGGGIGTAIGTIAGTIETVLSPSIDAATVSARNMNNELQKIDYYEGKVQGATTQVNIFDEQLKLLKQSLDLSTQSVYKQGEKLGISKTRMDELVKAVQDGKFTTDMLTGSEQGLAGSLTDLAQKQEHVTEVSKKLEEAQKKLLKAQTDLSIAQDVEAGNFEIAAARIEVAEAQGVYSTEDATAKRIQLYKQGGEEERKNLLQNLTPEQRKKMLEYNATTDKELKELNKLWNESSDEIKSIFTDSIDQDTINKFKQNLNSIDSVMAEHQGFWQGVGDTIAEIFSAGHAVTYTYNHEDAGYQEIANKLNSGKLSKDQVDDKTLTELRKRKLIAFAVGTNYVPNDGLAYLHQGEAVIPKKYNRPYQPNGISAEERAYMDKMIATMNRLDGTIAQGINVKGEFRQRGNDLVATVEKNKSRQSNTVLNNKVYAR